MKKQSKKDILVIGFALFSMFFGAGNLIFPPYIGLEGGSNWLLGFLCYFLADVGLALIALFAILKSGSSEGITSGLGKVSSTIILCVITLCIGPLVAVPRTAATTYEMSIKPLTSSISPVLFSIAFFLLIFVLCVKESAVIDIVGKFLTPGLLIGLIILIVKGFLDPIGPIASEPQISNLAEQGIQSGYQTLDVLAVIVFGVLILKTAEEKGYHDQKEKTHVIALSGIIACTGLFLAYFGLTYLGATASTFYTNDINRSTLVITIVRSILGYPGVVIFAIIVALACITTALALVSSCAEYFSELSHGKIPYKINVAAICIVSAFLSNVGLDEIVAVASPVLDIVYPPVLVLIAFTLICKKKPAYIVLHMAVGGALLASLMNTGYSLGLPLGFITKFPFYSIGFSWIVPTLIFTLVGLIIHKMYNGSPQ